jgi:hypothetical protein
MRFASVLRVSEHVWVRGVASLNRDVKAQRTGPRFSAKNHLLQDLAARAGDLSKKRT